MGAFRSFSIQWFNLSITTRNAKKYLWPWWSLLIFLFNCFSPSGCWTLWGLSKQIIPSFSKLPGCTNVEKGENRWHGTRRLLTEIQYSYWPILLAGICSKNTLFCNFSQTGYQLRQYSLAFASSVNTKGKTKISKTPDRGDIFPNRNIK